MTEPRCIVVMATPPRCDRRTQSEVGHRLTSLTLEMLGEQKVNTASTVAKIRTDHRGKPVTGWPGIEISIAHCPSLVLVAVMRDAPGPIGVDVEELRPLDVETLTRGVIGPHDDQVTGASSFLRSWVRKEAVAKATGHGLGITFSSIGVAGDAVIGPEIPYGGRQLRAHVVDLDIGAGHRAALAALHGSVPPRPTLVDVDLADGSSDPPLSSVWRP